MNKQNTIEGVYEGLLDSVRRVDNFPKPEVSEQIVYKLQHKYTKLFYDPKGSYQTVTEVGKVYSKRKPARQSHITIPYELRDKYDSQYHNAQTKLNDWEVIEYKLVKVNKGD
mgnify:CR=1 FL=1|tara:strand:- start:202 stop:537 length:336 start_codon:yes stop_codon:yes gene_type:complete